MTPQELKASILQRAIQGKLVEQRPVEGTGEELYLQIKAEKQRLIKSGAIKKEKPLLEIAEDEIPFDIPENWIWVRLNSLILLLSGSDLTPSKYNEAGKGIPYITGASNIEGHQLVINRWTEYPNNIAHKGDLLLTCKGTVGKTTILKETQVHIARQLMAITPLIIDIEYLKVFIESQVEGLKSKAKSMIPGIERDNVLKLLIPLPPLAEQKRIVVKIEELLPMIDRYEQAWSRLEDFNKRFPVDMQKSILQLAIQGKLVEQRPEEGTGEELFQQIQAEKQALIKAGKIKKEKQLPKIAEDELPFDIPDTWKWIRLGSVIDMLSGFAFKSSDFKKEGQYRLLRGINLSVGNTRWDDTVYVDEMPEKCASFQILKGDVLIGLDRPWISDGIRVAIYDDDENTYLVQRVLRIRETSAISKEYIALLLRSNLFKNAVEGETTGISVPHISPGQVGNVVVPLPPLAEQKRIVAKLETLLPLCDCLK